MQKVQTRADERVQITLAGKRIRRRLYGVGRCYVGGQPAVAVKAGRKRHINTIPLAARWLTKHGLSWPEAIEFVFEGLKQFDAGELPKLLDVLQRALDVLDAEGTAFGDCGDIEPLDVIREGREILAQRAGHD